MLLGLFIGSIWVFSGMLMLLDADVLSCKHAVHFAVLFFPVFDPHAHSCSCVEGTPMLNLGGPQLNGLGYLLVVKPIPEGFFRTPF
jgi:hypothetical protein